MKQNAYTKRLPKMKELLKDFHLNATPELMVKISKTFVGKYPKLVVCTSSLVKDCSDELTYDFEIIYNGKQKLNNVGKVFYLLPNNLDEFDEVELLIKEQYDVLSYLIYTRDGDPFNTVFFSVLINSFEELSALYEVFGGDCKVMNHEGNITTLREAHMRILQSLY